jgi:hypothetical protein
MMVLEIATEIYEAKYKNDLKLDRYLMHLENGIDLLSKNALNKSQSFKELTEMNLALEYNMQLLVSHII